MNCMQTLDQLRLISNWLAMHQGRHISYCLITNTGVDYYTDIHTIWSLQYHIYYYFVKHPVSVSVEMQVFLLYSFIKRVVSVHLTINIKKHNFSNILTDCVDKKRYFNNLLLLRRTFRRVLPTYRQSVQPWCTSAWTPPPPSSSDTWPTTQHPVCSPVLQTQQ